MNQSMVQLYHYTPPGSTSVYDIALNFDYAGSKPFSYHDSVLQQLEVLHAMTLCYNSWLFPVRGLLLVYPYVYVLLGGLLIATAAEPRSNMLSSPSAEYLPTPCTMQSWKVLLLSKPFCLPFEGRYDFHPWGLEVPFC